MSEEMGYVICQACGKHQPETKENADIVNKMLAIKMLDGDRENIGIFCDDCGDMDLKEVMWDFMKACNPKGEQVLSANELAIFLERFKRAR